MKKIIFASLVFITSLAQSASYIDECNTCATNTQYRQKALSMSNQAQNDDYIYIYSFKQHLLKKYIVVKEDVEGYSFGGVISMVPTNSEIAGFQDFDIYFDSFKDWVVRDVVPPNYQNPISGGTLGSDFGVYDLIGNSSAQRSIAAQLTYNHDFAFAFFNFSEWATSFLGALDLNITHTFVFTFPDGSTAVASFVNGELEFDQTTMVDSDGNSVPVTTQDAIGSTYRTGGSPNSSNYAGLWSRLYLLGAGGSGLVCVGECDADSCTVTCSRG